MTGLVGHVTSVAASIHAALGRVSAWSRALLRRCRRSGARGSSAGRLAVGGSGARGNIASLSIARSRSVLGDRSRAGGTASEDLGSRSLGRVFNVVASPNREVDLRVALLVHTGDLNRVGGHSITSAGDLDLSTAVVELRLATVGSVETNVLGADEVLAVGNSLGNLEGNPVLVPSAPSLLLDVGALLADGLLVDLEPVTRAIVGADTARGLRHIYLSRSGMLHCSANAQAHCERIASLDVCCGLGSLVGCAHVTAEVNRLRSDVVETLNELRGHVSRRTGVLTNKICRSLAVDDKLVEEVVSRCHGHHAREESNSSSGVHHLELLRMYGTKNEGVLVASGVERKTEVSVERMTGRAVEGMKRKEAVAVVF